MSINFLLIMFATRSIHCFLTISPQFTHMSVRINKSRELLLSWFCVDQCPTRYQKEFVQCHAIRLTELSLISPLGYPLKLSGAGKWGCVRKLPEMIAITRCGIRINLSYTFEYLCKNKLHCLHMILGVQGLFRYNQVTRFTYVNSDFGLFMTIHQTSS